MDLLSCKDLGTVDRLWITASNGKFCFSAQQSVLKALGDYRKMYDEVGWQNRSGEWSIEWSYNPQIKRMNYKPGKEPNFTVERGYNFDSSLDAALKRCNFWIGNWELGIGTDIMSGWVVVLSFWVKRRISPDASLHSAWQVSVYSKWFTGHDMTTKNLQPTNNNQQITNNK